MRAPTIRAHPSGSASAWTARLRNNSHGSSGTSRSAIDAAETRQTMPNETTSNELCDYGADELLGIDVRGLRGGGADEPIDCTATYFVETRL
ncbi:hypothetical protein GCM10023191_028520 [Actinoallomurus oryzae]|uniref:Uncharacterized protein n=1 Tax=Actinoallomurus oryzae TaxID=502180 RepID=A0ABP8PV54_9ACTN